jgi:hypothetical protein
LHFDGLSSLRLERVDPATECISLLNPDNPLGRKLVIPAQAGIQIINKPRAAGQHQGFVRFAEYLSRWIPACAGMTALMDYSG